MRGRRVRVRTQPRQAASAASVDRWERQVKAIVRVATRLVRSMERAERR